MAHFLVLSVAGALEDSLTQESLSVISLYGHTFDKITIPSLQHLPYALNKFSEDNDYEAAICISVISKSPVHDHDALYSATVAAIYDYIQYFGRPVGFALIKKKLSKVHLMDYVKKITKDTCEMILMDRTFYSLEERGYSDRFQRN